MNWYLKIVLGKSWYRWFNGLEWWDYHNYLQVVHRNKLEKRIGWTLIWTSCAFLRYQKHLSKRQLKNKWDELRGNLTTKQKLMTKQTKLVGTVKMSWSTWTPNGGRRQNSWVLHHFFIIMLCWLLLPVLMSNFLPCQMFWKNPKCGKFKKRAL